MGMIGMCMEGGEGVPEDLVVDIVVEEGSAWDEEFDSIQGQGHAGHIALTS